LENLKKKRRITEGVPTFGGRAVGGEKRSTAQNVHKSRQKNFAGWSGPTLKEQHAPVNATLLMSGARGRKKGRAPAKSGRQEKRKNRLHRGGRNLGGLGTVHLTKVRDARVPGRRRGKKRPINKSKSSKPTRGGKEKHRIEGENKCEEKRTARRKVSSCSAGGIAVRRRAMATRLTSKAQTGKAELDDGSQKEKTSGKREEGRRGM